MHGTSVMAFWDSSPRPEEKRSRRRVLDRGGGLHRRN